MLPLSVSQYQQRLDSTLVYVRAQAAICPMNMQHVYSSYLVVKTAGLVEVAVRDILGEYARQRGNVELQRYISAMIERENSLNCEKIERLFLRFAPNWWTDLTVAIPIAQREAVDSIKTLRDQFAHGKPNGTGFAIVDGYYALTRSFVQSVSNYIIP
jgi:hypothetical protein